MESNDWKYNYINNNKSGHYSKEKTVKEQYLEEYNLILNYTKLEIPFRQKCYIYAHGLNDIDIICLNPACNNLVNFISNSKGFNSTCSNSCSTIVNSLKGKETMYKKYGVSHPSLLTKNINNRKIKKQLQIEQSIYPAMLLSFDNDELLINCDKCKTNHLIHLNVYNQRIQLNLDWRNCITGYMNGTSNSENEIAKFIESNYNGQLILNDRKTLNGKELDIYLPELNLAIEYNGLYWHCELFKDKEYHHNKWKLCVDKNITLIQIYEDEWIYKQDIIKSRLLNLLNKSNKIYARKCYVKEVSSKESNIFLNENHLQGNVHSSIRLGLYFNNELVSLMTFGLPRKGMKTKTNLNCYELYRFCNKLNLTVIGGASKLFKWFINNYDFDEIYSYSALEWPGNLYTNLNMELVNISKYSYWFFANKTRTSRHNFNKQAINKLGYSNLKDLQKDLKIYKIYGPGNKRFSYIKQKRNSI